jgi:hypothetical protein
MTDGTSNSKSGYPHVSLHYQGDVHVVWAVVRDPTSGVLFLRSLVQPHFPRNRTSLNMPTNNIAG